MTNHTPEVDGDTLREVRLDDMMTMTLATWPMAHGMNVGNKRRSTGIPPPQVHPTVTTMRKATQV